VIWTVPDSGATRCRSMAARWRIESETEPPNWATEIIAVGGGVQDRDPRSPVRMSEGWIANTPRNRDAFPSRTRVCVESLLRPRLNDGGGSLGGARLWAEIPDPQGKDREIAGNWASRLNRASACVRFLGGLPGVFPRFGSRESRYRN
jgi:hypothetical protein